MSLTTQQKELLKVGPIGGNDGSPWDMGHATRILSMTFYYDDQTVHGFHITYIDIDGDQETKYFGGTKQQTDNSKTIELAQDETITSISGYTAKNYDVHTVIVNITISTNLGNSITFGTKQGAHFSLSMGQKEGEFVGFFGRAGDVLDAIGVYLLASIDSHAHALHT